VTETPAFRLNAVDVTSVCEPMQVIPATRAHPCRTRFTSAVRSADHAFTFIRRLAVSSALAFGVMALFGASAAHASAWTRPAGDTLMIFSTELSGGTLAFDRRGRLQPANRFGKFESRSYVETGLTEGTTLIFGSRTGRAASLPPQDQLTLLNLGQLENWTGIAAGLRQRLWHGSNWTTSLEVVGEHLRARRRNELGQTLHPTFPRRQVETRLAAGVSFDMGSMPAFMQATLGYRYRTNESNDDVLIGLGMGLRPRPGVLLLAQALSEWGVSSKQMAQPASRLKLQTSVVIDLWGHHKLQVSATLTPIGRNTVMERGLAIALWRNF
jgi:hypothetical protein